MGNPKTIPNSQLTSYNGKLNYVVLEDDILVVGKSFDRPGGGHIDLANGQPVQAAGEVFPVNGRLKYIDNSSGHYLPSGLSAQRAAESAFERLGLDVKRTYVEKDIRGQSKNSVPSPTLFVTLPEAYHSSRMIYGSITTAMSVRDPAAHHTAGQ